MKNRFLTILIILIFVISLGISTIFFTGNQTIGDGKGGVVTYYSPDFISWICDVVQPDKRVEYRTFAFDGSTIPKGDTPNNEHSYTTIDCNKFTKKCDISIKFDKSKARDQLTGLCGYYFEIFTCNTNDECYCTGGQCANWGATLEDTNNREIPFTTLGVGEKVIIRAWRNSGFLCLTPAPLNSGTLQIWNTYDVYGLKVQGDTSYKEIPNTCVIPNNFKSHICLSSDLANYKDKCGNVPNALDFNDPDNKYISYVNDYNPVSTSSVYTYKGKEVYCSGAGALYEFGEMGFADGSEKRLAPTKYLTQVDCCPWMRGCDDSFTWVQIETECNTDFDCRNNGQYYAEGNEAVMESCVSGKCTETDRVSVKCDGDEDCGTGYCDKRGLPNQWVCKQETVPPIYCGDHKCNGDENADTCFVDCGEGQTSSSECSWYDLQCQIGFSDMIRIAFSVLAGLIILSITIIYVPKIFKKKQKPIGYGMGILITIVSAFLIYLLFWIGIIVSVLLIIVLFIFSIIKR